jgi:hypothetical protein
MIYFVYRNTEFYQSPMKVIGTYYTKEEAIRRIEAQDVKSMETGACGDYWRTETHEFRYFIRGFPLGDCNIEKMGLKT